MSLTKRALGRTGLQVTVLGYGAMEIRGPRIWGGRPVTEQQAETILNAVLDAGINFIDTANDYGRSEEFIGKYLSKRRSEFYIATKCGCKVTYRDENTDDTPHEWTRENLFRGLHESLQRLKTDYIDIMQLHNPTVEQCQQGDLVNVLKEMQQQGKVRWIGCSSTLPHIRTYIEWNVFDVFQIPYSALERAHENVITEAAQKGAGIIDRGGVARGEPGAGLGNPDRWKTFEAAKLDELRGEGESRTAFLLRFLLAHPHIHTTIVGTLNPDHLRENVAAAEKGPLPPEIYEEAKRRLDAVGEQPQ
ncbi:aldo/keto reductase [Chthonomonas calidirosea]|uniref:Predicted oxidoreductases (Related to aryl-alcohol dehydrogenases) n=1 Tax=Chthonomonas calidirosea (strain DSM 23976 / ICMP 18418 / T49) TaxID=1303518 RepID=S0EYN5_CHTCT|nr:aldo/keto reductase [Chthonomonas calidirosea]CCW35554.1 Predicted oxidoreductases (related to aryl-alcohol dehydrogenases) [Chthonomonas calidirosea T49]CEK18938.1 predicted oxidoreductase, aryl-alcohol dehydrogenase like protein [Chthonomonas calidirosea]CEK19927.1 predicted oxidoreductase, aryl-alcohol dehydrogenase like protein [Chthonomonas calidirosea]